MKGLVPENILEDILSRINIVEVISGYIPLKRAGRNFKANCPFHQEKTPSFMVSPERQIYHCFGCGESGNAFKFLMRHERLEFPEAVEALAKKAGVVLPQGELVDNKAASISIQIYKINELAALFYEQNLNSSGAIAANKYLANRGISAETIKKFKLGLAPDKWDGLMNYLRSKGLGLGLIEKAGLIIPREGGGYYDRFRNRIIIPIFDIKSRVIGFGARMLAGHDDKSSKYVNSPETPIYTKGRNLYGLNFAKEAIRDSESAVIVEGYMDFIVPYQEGLSNIVASQGTALTVEQARLLKRYTANVVMVYDADDAGQMAMLRTLDIFIEEEMNVRIVSLPQGFDPDSFVRKYGIAGFKEKIDKADSLFDYKLKILKSRYNSGKIEDKARIISEMLPTINKFKNAILKSEYIKQLAEQLQVEEEALLQEMAKVKQDKPYADSAAVVSTRMPQVNPTEKLLIKLMMEEREFIRHIRGHLEPADFQDARASRLVSAMFDLLEQGKAIEPKTLINYLDDDSIMDVICESTFLPDMLAQDKEKIVDDCISRLKTQKLKLKRQYLHEEIKAAQHSGDQQRLEQLTQEFHLLIKKV